ncbi:MAG: UDP-N-acetylmuramoylalanine--D-glutamate ligase, partial [Myxococcota bacterium]
MGSFSVIGLARSGLAAANALARRGHSVQASDIRTPAQLSDYLAKLDPRVTVKLGSNAFRPGDTLVMSPGIRPAAKIFEDARAAGCDIIGEVALFQRLRPQAVPILAITGTDGKSTTTSWLGHIMSGVGPVWTGGNLGTPLCESLDQLTDQHIVV